jgi:hypothetical protein
VYLRSRSARAAGALLERLELVAKQQVEVAIAVEVASTGRLSLPTSTCDSNRSVRAANPWPEVPA